LKRTLVFRNGLSPLGLLRNCLEYALQDDYDLGGVFKTVKRVFTFPGNDSLLEAVVRVNDFRNRYVGHQETELTDGGIALRELRHWVEMMAVVGKAISTSGHQRANVG
jgi:type III restriction enzyme